MSKNAIFGIILLAIIGLVVYLVFFTGPSKQTMSEAEAKEISKKISNLIETGNAQSKVEADRLTADLLANGWIFVDYNQVKKQV